jgi:thioesterase domain-containing protein
VLGYAELARLLGREQPFYGLQARGLSGRDEPDARIEDMAASYVQAMRSLQPEGPYYLGGYCYGGLVAFEMARQLRAQGNQVALLAVLEGYAQGRREARRQLWHPRGLARFVLNLPYWLRDALREPGAHRNLPSRRRRKADGSREHGDWDAAVKRVIAANLGDEPDVDLYRRLMAMHMQAIRDYRPQGYPGRVTLFRVRALSLFRSHDPEMGWGKLAADGVEIIRVPGAHYNMLESPHVQVLAAKLKERLEHAQAQSSPDVAVAG